MFGIGVALVTALLFGTASIFSRRGLEEESFHVLLVVSLSVGAPLFLLVTFVVKGVGEIPLLGVVYAGIGAILGSVLNRSLYFLGIGTLGPGKSLSIYATGPLYAAVFAWFVLGESITPLVVMGTLAVVLGVAALSRDVRTQSERSDHSMRIVLYPLAGAALGALAVTFRKLALTVGIDPLEAVTVNMVVGFLAIAPLAATRWRSDIVSADRGALRNFVVASLVMATGSGLFFVGLRVTNASVFYPLVQTQPLFAVVLSAAFLQRLEVITRWTFLGSCITVGGAALVIMG